MNQYYYRRKGIEKPPISLEELIEKIGKGKIKPKTEIRIGENGVWQKAKNISMLKPYFDLIAQNQPKTKNNSQNLNINFGSYLDKGNFFIEKYWQIILGVLLVIFLISKCDGWNTSWMSNDKEDFHEIPPCAFDEEAKGEIINEYLRFRYRESGATVRGSIKFQVVNTSDQYSFKVTQIGLSTKNTFGRGSTEYTNPRYIRTVSCGETVNDDIEFPVGRSPHRIYALTGATEIICNCE